MKLSNLTAAVRRRKFGAAALVLYTVMAVGLMSPLSSRDMPTTPAQDLGNHLSGIIGARRALEEGQFPIRVAPDQNSQTRYPIFQFYGNLPYTLGGAGYLLDRFDPYVVWKLEVMAFLVLGAFFTYRCSRVLTRQPLAGLAAGAVFMTAPYVLTDLHGRFAFTELVSFMVLPAVFYWAWRSFAGRGLGPILASGVAWSALALSHNVSFLYGGTFFGLFFLSWLAPRKKAIIRCVRVGCGFALGLVLTAWAIVPQQMLVPELRGGLLANVMGNKWLTPLGVLLSPGLTLPVHMPTVYIGEAEHFGLQVGWPILAGVGLSLCYLRSPLARMQGRRAVLVRFLLLFGVTLFMVWTPVDIWRHLPQLFSYVQFSYRLLMFVVLWGSLLAGYALTLGLEGRLRPIHLGAIVLGLGWSVGPYMTPHKADDKITVGKEIAHPEMGRGGAGGAYLIAGTRLAETSFVHPDMNWASTPNGGVLDGMEFYHTGRMRAMFPTTEPGDELLLRGVVDQDVGQGYTLVITQDNVVVGQPELPPGPFDLRIPLPPTPDKSRVQVVVEGKPIVLMAPLPHYPPIRKSSYVLNEFYLAPRADRVLTQPLVTATAARQFVEFGHPTVLRITTTVPTLVQLPVCYYPHVLRVEVDGLPVAVRNLGCFVAVELPAGQHVVTASFVGIGWADTISLVGWIGVALGGLAVAIRRLMPGRQGSGGPPRGISVFWKRVRVEGSTRVEQPPQPASQPAPRSVGTWLSVFWSQVLFPSRTSDSTAWRWPALLLLLILPGLLLYPCMAFYLFEPDEGRYAEIPREMLLHGEWIVPCLQGEPYLDKPPLLYWLVMVSYSIFGIHDWAARLVPALAVHATVLSAYLIGSRGFGERTAFRGALLLTLTPGLIGVGRLLTMDSLLTLWVTLGLLAAFEATRTGVLRRGWWMLAAAACGLGLLAKGPIALVLVLPPLWLHGRLAGTAARHLVPANGVGPLISPRTTARILWPDRLLFLTVMLAVALPWYGALCLRNPEFARHFLWEHNIVRFLQPFDHLEPVWYYMPLLALGLLPATLLLVPFARYLGTGDESAARTRSLELGFAILAGLWCVLFFSLSGCKLPTYILPALPFLALALGHFLAHSSWQRSWTINALASAALAMQLLGHYVIVPWYAEYRSPLRQWAAIAQHCGDPDTPVVCYPRMCHSVAFYLGREDVTWHRSKDIDKLRQVLRDNPKTVLLLSHRHSLAALDQALPPELAMRQIAHFGLPPVPHVPLSWGKGLAKSFGETALDLADMAVVERRQGGFEQAEWPPRKQIP